MKKNHRKSLLIRTLIRFLAWWFAFAGLYSMGAVCPCCGHVGCPVGASGAGVVGGLLALFIQNWRRIINRSKLFDIHK
jgi:hypothetical protein